MGRRKKVVEQTTTEKEEVKVTKSKADAVKYQGTVKVSIVKGGRTFQHKVLHNNGRYPLFKFLAECLSGNYVTAESSRPKYISLFACNEQEEYPVVDETNIGEFFNSNTKRSIGAITFNGTPKLEVKEPQRELIHGSATLTYKFSIPAANLTSYNDINALALYSNETYENPNNPTAYIFCVGKDGKWTKLIDETSTSLGTNFSILIEWKMSFSN